MKALVTYIAVVIILFAAFYVPVRVGLAFLDGSLFL